jgi:metal-sulfur cluster biosynthetic enzyme
MTIIANLIFRLSKRWRKPKISGSLRDIKEAHAEPVQVRPSTRTANVATQAQGMDLDLAECLRSVLDPEIGVNIVDLGLVYWARRTGEHVDVGLTLTSRACPLGALVIEDVRTRIADDLPQVARVDVELVWEPRWSPDLINAAGRQALGRPS